MREKQNLDMNPCLFYLPHLVLEVFKVVYI